MNFCVSQKGEPDLNTAAKKILHDWQRGNLPWFVMPPTLEDADDQAKSAASPPQTNADDEETKEEGEGEGEEEEDKKGSEDEAGLIVGSDDDGDNSMVSQFK